MKSNPFRKLSAYGSGIRKNMSSYIAKKQGVGFIDEVVELVYVFVWFSRLNKNNAKKII
jgi:hypothetical protein